MLTQYKGRCFRCGKEVLPGKGDIQRIGSLSKKDRKQFAFGHGGWLVRCFNCKGQGNKIIELTKQHGRK